MVLRMIAAQIESSRRATVCGLALSGALLAASLAHSEVVANAYSNTASYSYHITGMPDFDQVRGAGPGVFQLPNSGYMYCAPTSAFNLFAYIANHGFPNVSDIGPQYWQSDTNYNAVGLNLLNVGNFMGTHPDDGTNGTGFREGARDYLEARSNAFTVSHYYANGNYAPTQATITHAAVCGSLVAFAYGRYEVIGSFNGIPHIDRGGGHVVTLSRSTRGMGDARRLWVRDPADEQSDLTSQSTFGNREYGLLFDNVVVTAPTFAALKVMTEIGVDAGAPFSNNRYIDEYLSVRPKTGYALTNESTIVTFIVPGLVGSFPSPPMVSFNPGGVVDDIIINPDMTGFMAVVTPVDGGASSLVCIDAATGEVKDLTVDLDLDTPTRVQFGRNRQLYVLDGRTLKCFDVDVDPPVETATTLAPFPVAAMAYNDTLDELVCVGASQNSLLTYPSSLAGDGSVMPMPAGVNLMTDSSIAYNPGEQTLMIHPGGGQTLVYQAVPAARGANDYAISSITLNGVVSPGKIEADDSGAFYVMGDKGAQAYVRGDLGRFEPSADDPFNGVISDGLFRLTHGRSNDSEFPVEKQYNILPEELMKGGFVADCVFDLDDDRDVDSADLAALLASWGQLGARADLDGNGVDSADLAAFLAAWGACD